MVYRETTNPPVATGDGMAAAYRAGAELRDMEFMQFHPTVLYVAGSSRYLISEAVRGEGAYLRDKNGVRFMLDVDPRAELAPRDVVAQAIVRCMERDAASRTSISICRTSTRRLVRTRFPGIDKVCKSSASTSRRDPIPVRPGAHYMIGGVTVDDKGRTTLPGLWAAGEVTSSGLHGANRLASNSLLEGLVFGAACGRGAAEAAATMPDTFAARPIANARSRRRRRPARRGRPDELAAQPDGAQHGHRPRRGPGCWRPSETCAFWCRYVLRREFDDRAGWELQNLLTVARLMIDAAVERQESRGTHFRSDFPGKSEAWAKRHMQAQVNRLDKPARDVKNRVELRRSILATATFAPATLDDLLKVREKAELIGGRIVYFIPSGDYPGEVALRDCGTHPQLRKTNRPRQRLFG